MTVKIDDKHGRYVVQLEESDTCDKEECIDYILTTLCRKFDCELIGRPYKIGDATFQDILSKRNWRWYTLDYRLVDRLYCKRRVRLFANPVTPELLASLGYKIGQESLRAMGATNRGGYIRRHSEGRIHVV